MQLYTLVLMEWTLFGIISSRFIISQDIQGKYIRTPAPSTTLQPSSICTQSLFLGNHSSYNHHSHLCTNSLHDEVSSHGHLDPSVSGTPCARGNKWGSCKLSISLSLDIQPNVWKRCTRGGQPVLEFLLHGCGEQLLQPWVSRGRHWRMQGTMHRSTTIYYARG